MNCHLSQKLILCACVFFIGIPTAHAMFAHFNFTTIEDATLLVPTHHPWNQHACDHVIRMCGHLLKLSQLPATDVSEMKKYLAFTQGMIQELYDDYPGSAYWHEKHRLHSYKKLIAWEIERRTTWLTALTNTGEISERTAHSCEPIHIKTPPTIVIKRRFTVT